MYQTLIWPAVAGDDAGRLGPPLDSQDLECAADPLVDGVRRDIELGRDFLGIQVLVDEKQAIELAGAEPRNAARNLCLHIGRTIRFRHSVAHPSFLQRARYH
jgi:hypothetical protein